MNLYFLCQHTLHPDEPLLSRTFTPALGLVCRRKKKEKMGKDSSSGSSMQRVPIWHSVDFADESRKHLPHGILSNESPEISRPPTAQCEAGSPIRTAKSHSSLMDNCSLCDSSERWSRRLRDSSSASISAINHLTGTQVLDRPESGSSCHKTLLGRREPKDHLSSPLNRRLLHSK